MRARWVLSGGAALLVVASGAHAALLWSAESTLAVGAVSPSITLGLGAGASKDKFIDGVSVSTNKTSFGANLHGKIGASADVKDVIRLYNNGTAARTVTLKGSQVTGASVTSFEWLVKDGTTTRATIDMLSADPSASFTAELATTYKLEAKFKIARGAGASDSAFSASVWSVFS